LVTAQDRDLLGGGDVRLNMPNFVKIGGEWSALTKTQYKSASRPPLSERRPIKPMVRPTFEARFRARDVPFFGVIFL